MLSCTAVPASAFSTFRHCSAPAAPCPHPLLCLCRVRKRASRRDSEGDSEGEAGYTQTAPASRAAPSSIPHLLTAAGAPMPSSSSAPNGMHGPHGSNGHAQGGSPDAMGGDANFHQLLSLHGLQGQPQLSLPGLQQAMFHVSGCPCIHSCCVCCLYLLGMKCVICRHADNKTFWPSNALGTTPCNLDSGCD